LLTQRGSVYRWYREREREREREGDRGIERKRDLERDRHSPFSSLLPMRELARSAECERKIG